MFGARTNIKSRFFPNGGKESPFLEELRDESVAREMEEWNFGHADNDDSTLNESNPRSGSTRNPFGPTRENPHDDGPFGRHNHHFHDHLNYENLGVTNITYFLNIIVLIMSVVTIICIMASTETATELGCPRPNAAQYALVMLFLSIVANLCVLTVCERYNLCCTIGRMEFFFHVLSTIFLSVAVFVYGLWLYSVGVPMKTHTARTSSAPLAISSTVSSMTSTTPESVNSTSATSIAAVMTTITAIEATVAEELIATWNVTEPYIDVNNPLQTTPVGGSTTGEDGTTSASPGARVKRHLAETRADAPPMPEEMETSNIKNPPIPDDTCAQVTLLSRQFYFAVASLIILFGIVSAHVGIGSLYYFPCLGLLNRDSEARAAARATHTQNHHRYGHSHQSPPGMEMRDKNNNNDGVGACTEPNMQSTQYELNGQGKMSSKPLILRGNRIMTSSPNVTPTKNISLLKRVAQTNLWGSNNRNPETKAQHEDKLHESIISADQLLETSLEEESDANVSTAAVVEANTTGEGDDVLFDAHDSALLRVVVKNAQNEKQS